MLILIKLLTWMASPTGFLVWGCALGVLIGLTRFKRLAKALVILAVIQLIVFALPITSERLLGELEARARALESNNKKAERLLSAQPYAAIVLLGGATAPARPPYRPYPDLGDAADRIWHAARLYKEGLAPKIIVSGGKSPGLEDRADIQTEAQSMALLLHDLGVPSSALILESESRTTRENARFTKSLVGNARVALVTSAFHMPRSIANFEKEGVKADAYPTDFHVAPQTRPLWARVLPTAGALDGSETALKEYLALQIKY